MIDRFEMLAARLRRLFSRERWSAHLLDRELAAGHADEPGLVIIQIDGLGEDVLRRALREGEMPFLRRLVEREGYEIHPLYAGLPSSTPAFQAELFYGVPAVIPAFRYFDPAAGRFLALSEPASAALLEARLAREGEGLLRGGSAWADLYSGGAAEVHMCASVVGLSYALRVLAPHRLLALVIWHAWSALRVLGNLALTTGLACWDLMRGGVGLGGFLEELRFVPGRVAVSTVMREIITTGAAVDAERGLPAVHLNYLGYDEHAHRRGPASRFARWSLRGIDRSIRRVWLAAHRSRRRDYQVWICSDHGQESVAAYEHLHGASVPEAVNRTYRRLLEGQSAGRVEVTHQGPAGFAYLPAGHDRDFLERLAGALVREAGIPLVILRDGPGHATAFAPGRRARLPEEAAAVLGAGHPHLRPVAEDLVKLAHHAGAGELMLLGWSPTLPLSLQVERGAHGGPGPAETSAFVLLPPEAGLMARIPAGLRASSLRELALAALGRAPRRAPEPAFPAPARAPAPAPRPLAVPLRLMTYNVHSCRGMDGKYAPRRIARVIARERPDIVCLQELERNRAASGGTDQVELIARLLEIEFHFHAVRELDDGEFGNAVLSALPIRPVAAGPLPALARLKSVLNLPDRGALWVTADLDGAEVHILNTHLSILQRERRLQAAALLGPEWLAHPECAGAVILAGDFNAAPRSGTMRLLARRLRSAVDEHGGKQRLLTWSGRLPVHRIDHVLVSDAVKIRSAHVPRTSLSRVASDHLPLVVDLVCYFPGTGSDRGERGDARGAPRGSGAPEADLPGSHQ